MQGKLRPIFRSPAEINCHPLMGLVFQFVHAVFRAGFQASSHPCTKVLKGLSLLCYLPDHLL